MFEIIFQAFIFVVLLPYWIAKEAYELFRKFMSKGKRWHYFPYALLAILIFLLIISWLAGYR